MMFLYAVSVTLLGTLLPQIVAELRIDLSQATLLNSIQSIGGMVALVFATYLALRVTSRKIISAGFALYLVMLLGIGYIDEFEILLAMFLLIGIGSRLVDTLSNGYVISISPQQDAVKNTTILHVCFGVGAPSVPLCSRFLTQVFELSWRESFQALGLLCIPIWIIFIFNHPTSRDDGLESGRSLRELLPLLRSVRIITTGLMMFLYFGFLFSMNLLLPQYLHVRYDTPYDSTILTWFWSAIILSRLIVAFFIPAGSLPRLLIRTSVVTGLLALASILISIQSFEIASYILIALLTGAYIPMLINMAVAGSEHYAGSISSLLYLFGYLGASILPQVMGWLLDSSQYMLGILLVPLSFVLMSVLCALVYKE